MAAVAVLAVAPSGQAPPAFRSGVDLVRVDVSVLGREGRPVTGLTARDFVVRDNGRERPIVAFSTVEVPEADASLIAWRREVRPDVATNDLTARRLVVIVLDTATGRVEPVLAARTRAIASDIVDALGPADLAAVVFTAGAGTENFTDDRARLRRAIAGFTVMPASEASGACPSRRCVVSTLARLSAALAAVPDRRKTVFYVSTSGVGGAESASLDAVLRQASLSNVTIYAIDPGGLADMARAGASPDPAAAMRTLGARQDALRALADRTGGRALVNSNDATSLIRTWLRESSHYYVLGFEADRAAGPTGERRIAVTVNRPDVDVRARRGYFLDPRPLAAPVAIGGAQLDLREAVLAPLPLATVALGVSAAAIASPDLTAGIVTVVANVRQVVAGDLANEEIRTLVGAFDREGRAQAWRQQSLSLTLPADSDGVARYGVLSKIELPPGSYELRLALARAVDGRPGSVHTSVDVPDFARAPLSMSGLVLESTAAPVTAPLSVVEGLLPLVPTALRDFRTVDQAQVLVRIYQGGAPTPLSASLSGTVIDAGGRVVFSQTTTLTPADFAGTRAAEGVFELPLETLAPGPYLLAVEATTGRSTVRRELRFAMH